MGIPPVGIKSAVAFTNPAWHCLSSAKLFKGYKKGKNSIFFKLTCSGFIFKLKNIEHFQLKFCYAPAS